MFALKRNQVVITALVVMIAVAGYLNYKDENDMAQSITLDDNGRIASTSENFEIIDVSSLQGISFEGVRQEQFNEDSVYVTDDNPFIVDSSAEKESGEAIFVNNTESSNFGFFASAKLEREQSRAKQKEILVEIINNEYVEKEKKSASADAMLDIQKRIEKETAAEAMIEAKGFKEVYVRIDDETVDVVVYKEALSEAEIAQIEDIVKRKTGMSSTAIRISSLKK
jgi:stage III sporulation protein AH